MASSALLESIALKYAKSKGLNYITDEAQQYAVRLLGIDKQQGNPKYTFGMPFTGGKLQINPMRMIANQGIKSIMGGGGSGILSTLGPLALGAGAVYFLNKNREKLTGYKTQQAYEDARNQRRADNRLNKITDRMISGKNYGNYERALLDSGAGAVKIDDVIYSGPDYTPAPKKPASAPVYHGGGADRDEGSTSSPSKSTSSPSSSSSSSSYSSSRGSNFGSRFHGARGGLASL